MASVEINQPRSVGVDWPKIRNCPIACGDEARICCTGPLKHQGSPYQIERGEISRALHTIFLGVPALRVSRSARPLSVTASTKKLKVAQPLGPSGDFKNKKGVDAGGRVLKGKGVYQFVDKYGANVDGYSPIYAREEWSAGGDSYAGGTPALAIWALLLGGLLVTGALLVYNTSALSG
uniref:Photosystem II 10 kDa polypeptide, chloroplastic n=1 Tax=Physcomitrium patens TaxID=3218 RepID=A0A7I4B428_PHYPA